MSSEDIVVDMLDLLESSYELLSVSLARDTCTDDCECILHSLEALLVRHGRLPLPQLDKEQALVTLIDFADEMAQAQSDYRRSAIYDAHDMAHVLLGGDRQRAHWHSVGLMLQEGDSAPFMSQAWPDIKRRMLTLKEHLDARKKD